MPEQRLRLLVVLGLGTVFLAMVILALMDVYPRSPSNPGGRYRVTEGIWVFLQFAIGAASVYGLPGIGAGYVILTAIGAALALGAATGILAVFVGIGWGGSAATTHDKLFLATAVFGFVADLALLTVAGRFAFLVSRRQGVGRLLVGAALAILSAGILMWLAG